MATAMGVLLAGPLNKLWFDHISVYWLQKLLFLKLLFLWVHCTLINATTT